MTDFEHMLVGLFRFFVLSAALTYYITQSVIFAPLRRLLRGRSTSPLGYLLYCPSCMGTWVGFALHMLGLWPMHIAAPWQEALLAMFASCCISRMMPADDVSHEINEWVLHDQKKEGENGKG
jgi:hypothetical protein